MKSFSCVLIILLASSVVLSITTIENRGCYVPRRYIFTFFGFFGMFNIYAMRVNLSVAMVAMINNTESDLTNRSRRAVECAMLVEPEPNKTRIEPKAAQYNWNSKTTGMILGAFYYGYIITQVPGGFLAEKFGAKWLYGGSVFFSSVLTLLSPLAASVGTTVFMVLLIIKGFVEGVTLPAMNYIISRWSPVVERSRLSTIIYMGGHIGTIVSLSLSGWLTSTDLFGGWPSTFYVFGTFSCIWFVFWTFLVYETPAEHPTVSKSELTYIQVNGDVMPLKKQATPWKTILTSLPVWATLVAHVGDEFGFYIYLIELPNYLSSILHFNITDIGVLSALPYIIQVLTACISSYIADKLRSSGILCTTSIRKILNTIGMIGPAICLFCITLSGCQPLLIVGLLTLGMALNGFVYSGFHINHVDMAPNFSGTLYGITNSFGNLNGVIAPDVVGMLTSQGATIQSWNKVFYISSAAYIVGGIFYLLFASAEQQPWDKEAEKSTNTEKKSEEIIR